MDAGRRVVKGLSPAAPAPLHRQPVISPISRCPCRWRKRGSAAQPPRRRKRGSAPAGRDDRTGRAFGPPAGATPTPGPQGRGLSRPITGASKLRRRDTVDGEEARA
jgi:hypothetical protein